MKMLLLNAILHIGPQKKNHLKFRQIQIVTMWDGLDDKTNAGQIQEC